jgi:hypothetical protein
MGSFRISRIYRRGARAYRGRRLSGQFGARLHNGDISFRLRVEAVIRPKKRASLDDMPLLAFDSAIVDEPDEAADDLELED